ncbi:sugar ABC transporter substrate-binding protein [Streptomyces sp. NPDC059080]|uniref:sugar ABC transporter substrate-binding protein n=1 Tax=Streptomyces sp. NPDC059080 TaxID=3346718 RepID=UPI00368D346C
MNAQPRRVLIGALALSLALPLAACGSEPPKAPSDNRSIGLLLPDRAARYDDFDRRIMASKIASRCLECKIEYRNAQGGVETQRRQFEEMVRDGVRVVVLDAVDARAAGPWVDAAAKRGVKVVAYDRLAEGAVAAYVSYDNEKIGKLQAEGLVTSLGARAATARVVMLDGSPSDPNAGAFKKGAHAVLDRKVDRIVYEKDIPGWSVPLARKKITEAVNAFGPTGFDAVYAANDGMAGAAADVLEAAGAHHIPLGGQDAELAALQRLVKGVQTFTVYKEVRPEAQTAGEIAVNLLQGKSIGSLTPATVDSKSHSHIPAKLFSARLVTRKNMADTVIRDGAVRTDLICTKDLAADCAALGLD